jgi:hypothetical protein
MELMIGLGIMAVLSSSVIVAINPTSNIFKSLGANRTRNSIEMQHAAEQYLIEHNNHPANRPIPEGEASAVPICRNAVGLPGCINVSAMVPDFIVCVPYEEWPGEQYVTGYKVYGLQKRFAVIPAHPMETTRKTGCDDTPFPQAYWSFDIAGATVTDLTGRGQDAQAMGSVLPTHDPTTPALKFMSSGSFSFQGNGADSYMEVSSEEGLRFKTVEPFSITAWVWPSVDPGKLSWPIVAKQRNDATLRGYIVSLHNFGTYPDSPDAVRVQLAGDAGGGDHMVVHSPLDSLEQGEWNHIGVTYDGSGKASGIRIIINGKNQSLTVVTDALTQEMASTDPLRIGADASGESFFGFMDDVRIYRRTVTSPLVQKLKDGQL